ncbi:MAG: succinate dehydrogenase, cytochrome b556 subunit [Hyphomonadaceae bacterium]
MAGAAAPDKRPLSPHLQVWRWHVTMAGSILHRVTGVGLYLGLVCLVIWLAALAAGQDVYAPVDALLQSWLGQAGLYLLVATIAYHAANGVRHLVWDAGAHLVPKHANISGWAAIAFAFVAPAALWAWLNFGAQA